MIEIQQRFICNAYPTRRVVLDILLFGAVYHMALNPESAVVEEIAVPSFLTAAQCVRGV